VMEYYNNLFKTMFDQMRLVPGCLDFIQKAHKRGFKLGLATSALPENQQRIFERFNLSRLDCLNLGLGFPVISLGLFLQTRS